MGVILLGLLRPIPVALRRTKDGSGSDPWADVSHQVSVDPVDDAGIDISHLEQRWNLGVPGPTIDPNHISHPPVVALLNDHGHPCFDMQENGI